MLCRKKHIWLLPRAAEKEEKGLIQSGPLPISQEKASKKKNTKLDYYDPPGRNSHAEGAAEGAAAAAAGDTAGAAAGLGLGGAIWVVTGALDSEATAGAAAAGLGPGGGTTVLAGCALEEDEAAGAAAGAGAAGAAGVVMVVVLVPKAKAIVSLGVVGVMLKYTLVSVPYFSELTEVAVLERVTARASAPGRVTWAFLVTVTTGVQVPSPVTVMPWTLPLATFMVKASLQLSRLRRFSKYTPMSSILGDWIGSSA